MERKESARAYLFSPFFLLRKNSSSKHTTHTRTESNNFSQKYYTTRLERICCTNDDDAEWKMMMMRTNERAHAHSRLEILRRAKFSSALKLTGMMLRVARFACMRCDSELPVSTSVKNGRTVQYTNVNVNIYILIRVLCTGWALFPERARSLSLCLTSFVCIRSLLIGRQESKWSN